MSTEADSTKDSITIPDYEILSEGEKSDIKRCNKCGEIYYNLFYSHRQGDSKCVPRWRIIGMSGIKEPKNGIETCIEDSGLTTWEPWIWGKEEYGIINLISHYDDKALEEIEKGNCIMKGCDGNLEFIKINRPIVVNTKN
jgi:hypothetical protein